ncbi:MAG: type 4a pilus biogenesis protein PilO [SAR324 cluster bacterium]|nr:type 4a pilus biogenesis protein PilO [SAR324 cluster bacterium]MBL7035106.1 type 4a pilus biogenesis protein PilO [SAR324 cluster bacterium]
MTLVSAISVTDWNYSRSRQYILFGLLLLFAALLFNNFLLQPELSHIKLLQTKIQQLNKGLLQIKTANNNAKQLINFQALQERETALELLFPNEWKRVDLLRWLTKSIQKNGLIFERQTLLEQTPTQLSQALNIHLLLRGKYQQLQHFLNQLKQSPRLLVLKKLHLENTTPALKEPNLKIELVLSAFKKQEYSLAKDLK